MPDRGDLDLVTPHEKRKILSGFGRQGTLKTGQTNVTLSAQADFGETTIFTVQLDINLTGAPAGSVAFCLAIVEWTINGITLTRTVDVALGVSISGLAESVRVRMTDSTPSSFPNGISYIGTILIATNPRPTTAVPPVLTALYTTNILNGASTPVLPVPSGGNSLVVLASTATGVFPALRVRFQTASGVDLIRTVAPSGQTFIPLPTGTGQAIVDNMGAAAADISVLWGIDG
jgi:hypothetical protein